MHPAYHLNGRGGLTVPSWCAEYYLTGNIYVVDQDGVSSYHNRNPGSDLTTRDHRLEHIRAGDVKDGLLAAVRDLPDAPCCIVLCLDAEGVDKWYARLETGFVGGNVLLPGSALGMGCWFTTELSGDVQVGWRRVLWWLSNIFQSPLSRFQLSLWLRKGHLLYKGPPMLI